MPREKQGKRKAKGAPQSIVSILQKFLKTYEKRCVQTQTSVCPAIKRDLKASINHERILRKVSVSSQETKEHGSSIPSSPELAGSPALRSCLHAIQSLTLAPKSARHSSYLPTPPSQSAHPRPSSFEQLCLFSPRFTSGTASLPLLPLYVWRVQLESIPFVIIAEPPSPALPTLQKNVSLS